MSKRRRKSPAEEEWEEKFGAFEAAMAKTKRTRSPAYNEAVKNWEQERQTGVIPKNTPFFVAHPEFIDEMVEGTLEFLPEGTSPEERERHREEARRWYRDPRYRQEVQEQSPEYQALLRRQRWEAFWGVALFLVILWAAVMTLSDIGSHGLNYVLDDIRRFWENSPYP